jgi:hypothetical protein
MTLEFQDNTNVTPTLHQRYTSLKPIRKQNNTKITQKLLKRNTNTIHAQNEHYTNIKST